MPRLLCYPWWVGWCTHACAQVQCHGWYPCGWVLQSGPGNWHHGSQSPGLSKVPEPGPVHRINAPMSRPKHPYAGSMQPCMSRFTHTWAKALRWGRSIHAYTRAPCRGWYPCAAADVPCALEDPCAAEPCGAGSPQRSGSSGSPGGLTWHSSSCRCPAQAA